jgi:tetratricopeptide (TPR) repeat protein
MQSHGSDNGSHGGGGGESPSSVLAELVDRLTTQAQRGEPVDWGAVERDHPEHAGELRRLWPALGGLDALSQSGDAGLTGLAARSAAAEELAPGVLGDFRLLREVGRGGMGVVYEAEQISLGRRVALKVLPFAATMDPRHLQRFQNEARAAASLHHEHIVPVYAVGQERGVYYYAMQFIDGRTLAQFLERQRQGGQTPRPDEPTTDYAPATPAAPSADTGAQACATTVQAPRDAAYFRRVAEWGVQAAEALEHAHQLGIVHRDIKPGNLMLDGQGKLWVTDFGLARVGADSGLTLTGDLVGTLRYMSPEQALAKRVVIDHRTDIYSLGVTLYELLAGQPAVGGTTREEILRQIVFAEPRRPRQLNRAIPPDLETIVLKASAQEPERRYATAQELADDLRRWLEDKPIRARRPPLRTRLARWGRRHRPLVAAVAAALLMGLAVLAGSIGWVLRDQSARQAAAEEKVREALAVLEPGLRQGNPHAPDVVRAARQAEAHLAGGLIGLELRQQAEQLLADLAMLAKLEQIRLDQAAVTGDDFDQAGAVRAYAKAFGQYGIDVGALSVAEAAARVRGRVIAAHLVAALEDWALAQKAGGPRGGEGWRRLLRVAQAADTAADQWSTAFREELLRGARREALRRLAEGAATASRPAVTLSLLTKALRREGQDPEGRFEDPADAALAVRLLREGHRRHPTDFWLNHELAKALTEVRPSELDEAIGFYRAALMLRPESPGVHNNFGTALKNKGRLDEAIAAYREALRLKQDSPVAHNNLGSALFRKGRLDEAIACFKEALRLRKDFTKAHYNLGFALAKKGRPDGAIACYREAIRLKKDFPEAHGNLGALLCNSKQDYDGAIAAFRQAICLKKDYAEAHLNLGIALAYKGRRNEAIAACRDALRLKKDYAEAHAHLGLLLLQKGRLDEAIAACREAIRLKKDDAHAHYSLGLVLRRKNRLDEAIACYREALRLKQDDPVTHYNLGNALRDKGQLDEAIAEYREALRLNKDLLQAHINLGTALEKKGRLDEAIASFQEALRLRKDDPDTHYNLGNALKRKGDVDGAIAAYREALRLKPDDPEAHFNLGVALASKGRLDGAIAACREAIRLKPDYPEAHHNLGIALWRKGDVDGAIAAYREAVRLKQDYPEAHNNLGALLCDDKQDYDGAIAAFRQALRLKQAFPEAHHNLGVALSGKGQFDEAIAAFQEALRLKKDYPEAHLNLGKALAMKGRLDEAIAAFQEATRLKVDYPEAAMGLGLVLSDRGDFVAALRHLRRGHELGSRSPRRWPYPSAQWVADCERLAELDGKLPKVLAGEVQPADAAERIALAQLCEQHKKQYAAAARFYADAFARQPALADDLNKQHRYEAACAAALAGCGQGKDAGRLDDKERTRLRRQALDWLRADLSAYRRLLDKEPDKAHRLVHERMRHWQQDKDFAGVRGANALTELPEAERQEWRKLWQDVEALRKRAAGPPALQKEESPQKK